MEMSKKNNKEYRRSTSGKGGEHREWVAMREAEQ
jgi:hypothetical protein